MDPIIFSLGPVEIRWYAVLILLGVIVAILLGTKESKKFMASCKKMISEVNDSFKKILSSMYQEDLVDADAEMKVFNQMLKSESFNESELNVERDEDDE